MSHCSTSSPFFPLKPIGLALPRDSGRAGSLSELLASVRRQGVRAEGLLKDADNLTQRYKKLEARLQRQADAQNALEGQCDDLGAQADSARTWIAQLLQPLASPAAASDVPAQEMKEKAQVRTEPRLSSRIRNILLPIIFALGSVFLT